MPRCIKSTCPQVGLLCSGGNGIQWLIKNEMKSTMSMTNGRRPPSGFPFSFVKTETCTRASIFKFMCILKIVIAKEGTILICNYCRG